MKWLTSYSKKREAAKGFSNQQSQQATQTFILEPILTPSGILDGGDDTPDPLTLDWETNNLPDIDTVDTDSNVEIDDVAESEVSETNTDLNADSSLDEVAINSLENEISDEDLEIVDFIEKLDSPEDESDEFLALNATESEIAKVDSPEKTVDYNSELAEISNNEIAAKVSSTETEITNTSDAIIDTADDTELQLITESETDSSENLSLDDSTNGVDEIDTTLASDEVDEITDLTVDDISFSEPNFDYDSGLFTVGETGEIGIDFLFDGGKHQGELAIFSLDGMDEFEPGSQEFIKEAASRALSSSTLGHVVISDPSEGARFSGELGERNWNNGTYLGVKTFTMRPGDTFAVMLVPNGKVEQVFNNPAIGGAVRPLFSLVTSNPNDAFHVGQIADVTGDGNTFVMEDMRVDQGSDRDYNDIIFQVRGATGKAALMDDVVANGKDWRTSDLGQGLIAYAEPYITPEIVDDGFFVEDESWIYGDEFAFYDEYLDSQFEEDFPSEDFPEIADFPTGEEVVADFPEVADLPIDEAVVADNEEVSDLLINEEIVGEVPANSTIDEKEMLFSSPAEKSSDIGSDVTDEVTAIEEDIASNLSSDDSTQEEIVSEASNDEPITLEVVTTDTSSDLIDDSFASQEVTEVVPENVSDKPIDVESSTVANNSEVSTGVSVAENSSLPETTTSSVTEELTTEVIENSGTTTTNLDVSGTNSSVVVSAETENEVSQVSGTELDVFVEEDSIAPDTTEVSYIPPTSLAVKPAIEYEFPPENQPLIGVIDTGFAANNPDIDYSRITLGTDLVANDANPLLVAGEGSEHGTHVLGIIAAEQNNNIGIDGINDDAPLWVGRAIGSGKWAESLVEFVDAAKESAQPNAVVNLSLDLTQVNPDGSVTTRYEFTPTEMAAIEYARQHNVLIVVAAGNDGGVMSALGQASQTFDNIITVGAAERVNDSVALSKAYDRADYSSYGYGLDIVADGGTVDNPILSTTGDSVGTMAGTSVASAKVTGAVSQVWAANPNLSYRQVIELLKNTATDLKTPNWDTQTGAGLLNIAAAVSFAKVTTPESYETPEIYIPDTWSGEGQVVPTERAANSSTSTRFDVNKIIAAAPSYLQPFAKLSIPRIIAECQASGITDLGQIAYILATAQHESHLGRWMEELASGDAYEGRRDLGNTQPGDGRRFKGRGYVQITGRTNYTRWSQRLGIDLVGQPTRAKEPSIAAKILVRGMRDGTFTGRKLSDYINGSNRNFVGARRIVNGTDKATQIAQIAENYFKALSGASIPNKPTPISGRRPYIVRKGDTLSGIAYRELGNANRWREIQKQNGSTFTEAEARRIQPGQIIYLPVKSQIGTGLPVTPPPISIPKPVIPEWQKAIDQAHATSPVRLGSPTSGYLDALKSTQGTTGKYRIYQNGTVHWSQKYGAVALWFDVPGGVYAQHGGSGGWLGFPMKPEYNWNGGRRTDFEGGYVYWDGQQAKAYRFWESPNPRTPIDNLFFQVHRGVDNRIYTRYSPNGTSWTAWAKTNTPNEVTYTQPVVATLNGVVYESVTGVNQKIYTRSSTDGINWSEWKQANVPNEATTIKVAMVAFDGKLYQSHVGKDHKIYTRSSSDGVNWTAWTKPNIPNEATVDAVAMAEFNGRLYQSSVGKDLKVYTRSSSDGINWTTWARPDVPNEATSHSIAMVAFNGKLYQSSVGRDNRVYTRYSIDGTKWSAWERENVPNEQTFDAPWLATFGDKLYQYTVGKDTYLYMRSSTDGSNWTQWEKMDKARSPFPDIKLKPGTRNLNFSRGQEWVTSTGYKFRFQQDGNLVLYNPQGRAIWATGTFGTNVDRFSVQSDGNVVLYDRGKAVWATDTAGNPGAYFAIQNDGNLVVYTWDGKPLFNTSTNGGRTGTFTASKNWLNKHGGNNNGDDSSITTYNQYLQRLYGGSPSHISQYPKSGHIAIDSVHDGSAPRQVYSLTSGVVKFIGKDQNGGNYVMIWNEKLQRNFFYVHFENFNPNLRVGQPINAGTFIGIEGWTGNVDPPGPQGRHTHVHVASLSGVREYPLDALKRL